MTLPIIIFALLLYVLCGLATVEIRLNCDPGLKDWAIRCPNRASLAFLAMTILWPLVWVELYVKGSRGE